MSGDFRWQGYTHQELYDALNSGPGPAAAATPASRWAELSGTLAEINNDLLRGVSDSTTGWTGSAAERAREGIGPLASWAAQAHAGAEAMRSSTELQAEHLSAARADMPVPVPATPEQPTDLLGGLRQLFAGQIDAEIAEAAHQAATTRAYEVMNTYQTSTASNTGTLTPFAPPPQVVAGAAAPERSTGDPFAVPSPLGTRPVGASAPAQRRAPAATRSAPVVPGQRPGGQSSSPAEPERGNYLFAADGLFGDSHAVVPPVLGEH